MLPGFFDDEPGPRRRRRSGRGELLRQPPHSCEMNLGLRTQRCRASVADRSSRIEVEASGCGCRRSRAATAVREQPLEQPVSTIRRDPLSGLPLRLGLGRRASPSTARAGAARSSRIGAGDHGREPLRLARAESPQQRRPAAPTRLPDVVEGGGRWPSRKDRRSGAAQAADQRLTPPRSSQLAAAGRLAGRLSETDAPSSRSWNRADRRAQRAPYESCRRTAPEMTICRRPQRSRIGRRHPVPSSRPAASPAGRAGSCAAADELVAAAVRVEPAATFAEIRRPPRSPTLPSGCTAIAPLAGPPRSRRSPIRPSWHRSRGSAAKPRSSGAVGQNARHVAGPRSSRRPAQGRDASAEHDRFALQARCAMVERPR